MDELEREDFTRLKKVQSKKAEKLKAEELEKEAQKASLEDDHKLSSASSSTNVLSGFDAADDDDVVFK